ncbi:MAG: transposase [Deltaproteobacteria bacterium]|nr:transposase [Deltaproteobacteria bacterium]
MRVRLADVFRSVADEPVFSRLPSAVGRAFRDVMRCRTVDLGGHWSECENGHVITRHYNACRNRSCPRCAYHRRMKWLERQARLLLGCAHHHVIFTVPHELNQLWRHNYRVLGALLFESARQAIFTLAADPKYLGAIPGVLMALHTWGQQLFLHPHVHTVITAGGARLGGGWIVARRRALFPFKPLQILFRETFCHGLLRLAQHGRLRLPQGWDTARVKQLCRDLRQRHWNVEVRERYENPTAVLNYLGRYLSGGPISETRLLAMDEESVCFRYKDNRSEGLGGVPLKVMRLSRREFVRRVLQHVPPRGFHMVREYGLYRRGAGLSTELRDEASKVVPLHPEVLLALTRRLPPVETVIPTHCPICGKPVFLRSRPRPGEVQARAA